MRFNPAIEGLRGISILLVVMAHAGVPGMDAGFFGVDVFFVISGFLITGLLCEELRSTGRVDLWGFYARRARRLLPALLLMVTVVSIFVVTMLPRAAWSISLDPGFWSLLWSSNIYFGLSGFDYFGPSAEESLFLHTWSLGVEEQFYLVWPLLLHAAWVRGLLTIRVAGALLVVGFAASQAWLHGDAKAAYYLMPSRFWQFTAGAAAWLAWSGLGGRVERHGQWFGFMGLALLAIGLLLIDRGQPYPGPQSLLPTVGAACLLLAVAGDGSRLPWLRNRGLQQLGRVSYGWYLWHWPFLLGLPALGLVESQPLQTFLAVMLSLLVACASYSWLEQPLRRSRGRPRVVVLLAVIVSMLAAVVVSLAWWWPRPSAEAQVQSLEERIRADVSAPEIYRNPDCDQWFRSDQLVPCIYDPSGEGAKTVVFIGDSIGAQWLPALYEFVRTRGLRLVVLTKSSCPMVDEPIFLPRINRRFTECETWRRAALEYTLELRPAWVILGSSQPSFTTEQWREGTRRVIKPIMDGGIEVLVLAPTPKLALHVPQCLAIHGRIEAGRIVSSRCRRRLSDVSPSEVTDALREAVAGVPGSALVDLNHLVCPGGYCGGVRHGRVTYRDEEHLNAGFVEDLSGPFAIEIERGLAAAERR